MMVLVDYANVEKALRLGNVSHVVRKVLESLGPAALASCARVSMRFYGGWYDQSAPTRLCQRLASEIQGAFPKVEKVIHGGRILFILANAELAYSIAAEPHRHLLHTYRVRGMPRALGCRSPSSAGCRNPNCPLLSMHRLFVNGHCQVPGCTLGIEDFIYRSEQKLVDTMLAVDLLFYATRGEDALAVVTSDDDLWPAIRAALMLGRPIFHIHANPGRRTPTFYSTGSGTNYHQRQL